MLEMAIPRVIDPEVGTLEDPDEGETLRVGTRRRLKA